MLILLAFAIVAGAGTALSPCVLPVLPALLSAGGVGGRRRPLGVVLGLTITFTITIAGVAKVVGGVGLGSDPLRDLATGVLLVAGAALLLPGIADHLEARLSRLAALGPRSHGAGFRSGLLVGAALGFVYTPCAGPILAAVISVSAASGRTIVVAVAYALGSALTLLALTLGGRALFERVRRAGRGLALQRVLGLLMVLTAVAIITGLDVEFDQYVAEHIPEVSITASLERSHVVESRLHELTGSRSKLASAAAKAAAGKQPVASKSATQAALLSIARGLPKVGKAPEFTHTQDWFDTPGDRPLTLSSLRGRVVLVDFWTYTCINCIRTLPYLKAWDAAYRKRGLTIVGVHTPEFSFEHDAGNVRAAIARFGISYPVVQDNEYGTWNAYGNQYWPADYLIDTHGDVRYATFGEGDYEKTETTIRALLAEAGEDVAAKATPTDVITPSNLATPETYLGTARAERWVMEPVNGLHDYGLAPAGELPLSHFAFSGTWKIASQPATAVSMAGIDVQFQARNVYLVLSSQGGRPRKVQVRLDGRPVLASDAGADVHDGAVTVTSQRLYTLVSLPSDERHRLSLSFSGGVTAFAFTFG
jgi:cytochrome c biogenesis protein CcdA/thiol-disulfide isomerase/thioredoxin